MNTINFNNERQSSINISRSTKGIYTWDVKLYFDEKAENGLGVIETIKVLDAKLKESFKSSEGVKEDEK